MAFESLTEKLQNIFKNLRAKVQCGVACSVKDTGARSKYGSV